MKECTFNDGTECKVLTEKRCEGCRFRKTTEELIEGRKKAEKRVRNLPKSELIHIYRKYYGRSNPESDA